MLLRALNWQNAWRIRMVALVNTFAAESPDIDITVPSHVSEGNVAAANGTQFGVCTYTEIHYSPASLIALSKADRPLRSLVHHCISSAGHLHLSLPSMNPDPISKDNPRLSRHLHQTLPEDAGH